MPSPGEDQDVSATWYVYARSRIIELLSGTVAEDIFDNKSPRLNCGSDIKIANIFAGSICSEDAVPSFIDYCSVEAHSILKNNWNIVLAVAQKLEVSRTLIGAEIDLVIAETVSKDHAEVERVRRSYWRNK